MAEARAVAQLHHDDEQLVSESLTKKALRSIWRDKLTVLALAVVLFLVIVAVLAPFITGSIMQVDPDEPTTADKFTPPLIKGYILGADDIGRDQLARLLHASGVSIGIGFFGSAFALSIGLVIGMTGGYFGGSVDDFINWIVTTVDSIPGLFLLILISSVLSFTARIAHIGGRRHRLDRHISAHPRADDIFAREGVCRCRASAWRQPSANHILTHIA